MAQWLRHGFNTWSSKIPRTTEQPVYLKDWACALEPTAAVAEAGMPKPISTAREATAVRGPAPQVESSPCSLQPEKACALQQDQHSHE